MKQDKRPAYPGDAPPAGNLAMNLPRPSFSPRTILQVVLLVGMVAFLPLLISGRWGWWEAWAYALLHVGGFGLSRWLAGRRHPDLLAERARLMQHDNVQPWDRRLAPLLGLAGALIPLSAGLEARLGGPVVYALAVKVVALIGIVAGFALGTYAMMENRFFSGVVRLQTDRGHRVVTGGPYGWVRHPGYAGALLSYLATPFPLDSIWAVAAVALVTIVLVIRTVKEDSFLQAELEGYKAYAERVRFRLVPGLW